MTNLRALVHTHKIPHRSIILLQDTTMQLRMDATLKKHANKDMRIINTQRQGPRIVNVTILGPC